VIACERLGGGGVAPQLPLQPRDPARAPGGFVGVVETLLPPPLLLLLLLLWVVGAGALLLWLPQWGLRRPPCCRRR
jgi:hypothetical protein